MSVTYKLLKKLAEKKRAPMDDAVREWYSRQSLASILKAKIAQRKALDDPK